MYEYIYTSGASDAMNAEHIVNDACFILISI